MSLGWFVTSLFCFIVCSWNKVYFHETFDNPASIERWVYSNDKSVTHGVFARVEQFEKSENDFGLKLMNESSYYHFSIKLDNELDTRKQDVYFGFVAQYMPEMDCGGAYLKLFEVLDPLSLTGNSPYSIMFGPDICGYSTKQTHFIVSHKGKNYQIKSPPSFETDAYPHLFMIKIDKQKNFDLKVDGETKVSGDLKKHFDYLLPKQIDDPNDKKPDDWVDEETIADPNDIKPSDWEDEENIPDPDAKKPEDWNDEKDGVWERDMIKNPNYKGEWSPKQIPNPAYKGVWMAKQIDNPDYVDDNTFADFSLKYIGVDIWTVKSGTIFDEIFLVDDEKEANQLTKSILEKLKLQTKKLKETESKKASEENKGDDAKEEAESDDEKDSTSDEL